MKRLIRALTQIIPMRQIVSGLLPAGVQGLPDGENDAHTHEHTRLTDILGAQNCAHIGTGVVERGPHVCRDGVAGRGLVVL